jgi:hypothetical protein
VCGVERERECCCCCGGVFRGGLGREKKHTSRNEGKADKRAYGKGQKTKQEEFTAVKKRRGRRGGKRWPNSQIFIFFSTLPPFPFTLWGGLASDGLIRGYFPRSSLELATVDVYYTASVCVYLATPICIFPSCSRQLSSLHLHYPWHYNVCSIIIPVAIQYL